MAGDLIAGRISSWWLLPLACWAVTLALAAAIDAATQLVPRVFVRASGAGVGLAVAFVAIATANLGALWFTAVAALASFLIFGVCWRFAGLGFGDVRLAVLGSLGLGHARLLGVVAGCGVLALVVLAQSLRARLRTHDGAREFPYGPAIAAGYLVAGLV
jgi:leader peptidase (prepilin peptidase)/N-methyltransferase